MNRVRRGAILYAYFKLYSVYRGKLADSSGGLLTYGDLSLVGIFDGRVQLPFLIMNVSRAMMKALIVWMSFVWIHIESLVSTQLISRDEASLKPSTVDHFFQPYWKHNSWRGASGWTGDVMSRLMVTYLSSQQHHLNQSDVERIFTHIASRSLNAWTLLQYLTQANDDFGWTVVLLLDTLQYTHQYAELYPHSDVADRLPILRNRLAFRAGFLHDVMVES